MENIQEKVIIITCTSKVIEESTAKLLAKMLEPPLKMAREVEKNSAGTGFVWREISPEELSEYEADNLCIAVETSEDKRIAENWTRTLPAWQQYPAIRQKRVFFLNWMQWIIYAPHMIRLQLHEAGHILSLCSK
ncbi:hypothetical protein [Oceanobacillus sojae]|uniref:hypothetical protein n=1 Tax=Oceanobacillus sojae TaxID=582851 RepID=UPI0009888719|nr:hypothetical protein [Oceanobacillus sojae]